METFRDYEWQVNYSTSELNQYGEPTDMLRDFYIPALMRAKIYDRVAGYFRSSSLAAASEGFTSFVQHDGAMRLIVGADIDPDDVQAVLEAGDAELAKRLIEELGSPEAWPQTVKNGVELMAYMLASGRLQIKVAFRKNTRTGKYTTEDDVRDGYVHEKWLIMEDYDQNHIAASGSFNESRTALTMNAENIRLDREWVGGSDVESILHNIDHFDRLWNDKEPHMTVRSIPAAVKERLIKFAPRDSRLLHEIDGRRADRQAASATDIDLGEVLRFAVIKDAPHMRNGRYVGMYSAPIDPWPHQEVVSHRIVETYPYSYMLCDEVGLGKTIETALAVRSLYLSGLLKRVLIVAPKSLTRQWLSELAEKAVLPFALSANGSREYLLPRNISETSRNLYAPALNIISSGLIARDEHRDALKHAEDYDMVLVDEAQYLRRKTPDGWKENAPEYGRLYRTISDVLRPKTKCMLLATATPMQLNMVEVYDLFRLTDRVGAYKYDPALADSYFAFIAKLASGKYDEISLDEWMMAVHSYELLKETDKYLGGFIERAATPNAKAGLQMVMNQVKPLELMASECLRPLFASSPLSRVMMRHTRGLLKIYRVHGELKQPLAERRIDKTPPVKFTEEEKNFYDMLEVYCEYIANLVADNAPGQAQMIQKFYARFLQLRFASSFYAIQMTLERRLEKVKKTLEFQGRQAETGEDFDDFLYELDSDDLASSDDMGDDVEVSDDELLRNREEDDLRAEESIIEELLSAYPLNDSKQSKMKALVDIIDERRRLETRTRFKQTVIFTRFYDTLTAIKERLKAEIPTMRIGVFSGQEASYYDVERGKQVDTQRDDIKNRFVSGDIDILLCTDAAAEGLNLQTADLLVNFDMGWNPMKIEQRIGRIDRIGQTNREIHVKNLYYSGSAEEAVYGRLSERLSNALTVTGGQQEIMLPIFPDDFERLKRGELSEEELYRLAQERLMKQREESAALELSPSDQYQMYQKMTQYMQSEKLPARLSDMWDCLTGSKYLAERGAYVDDEQRWHYDEANIEAGTIEKENIPDVDDFLTWGNAKVDSIVGEVAATTEGHEDKIRRVSVKLASGAELVAYVVATDDGAVLVEDYETAKGVTIGDYVLTDEDEQRCKDELEKQAAAENRKYRELESSIAANEMLSKWHALLVARIAAAALKKTAEANDRETFWPAWKDMKSDDIGNLTIDASKLPAPRNLMFFTNRLSRDNDVVRIEDQARESILTYTASKASALKKRRSDISVEDVEKAIKADITRMEKAMLR